MFNQIGGLNAIGSPLPPNQIGGESFIRHIGNDKLIFDFKSGSGTTVKDRSREGNDSTFGAGTTAPTWKRNNLYFDGGNYIDLTGINHGISTGEFTFCISLSDILANDFIFDQETNRIYLQTQADGTLKTNAKIISDDITSVSPLNIQVTKSNSNALEVYINGESENKGETLSDDITYDGVSPFLLGSYHTFGANLVSTMYSFRILNECLSGIEAFQIYLSEKFRGNN